MTTIMRATTRKARRGTTTITRSQSSYGHSRRSGVVWYVFQRQLLHSEVVGEPPFLWVDIPTKSS